MRNTKYRLTAGLAALTLAASICGVMPVGLTATAEMTEVLLSAEAEDLTVTKGGQATDKVYDNEYPGFTGTGFVWAGNEGGVSFDVTMTEGAMCELTTRCYSYLGDRIQNVAIDGVQVASQNIPLSSEWTDVSWGFFYLEKGEHTIEIGSAGSWGFILYDSVEFGIAKMPDLDISPELCDPKATPETKALMSYLTGVYGKQILSGQQEIYGSGHNDNTELEFEYLYDTTGQYPAIRGFDFMNYNPLYGWEDGTTGRVLQWVTKRGGIATASWHINVPIDFENYELGEFVDWQDCSYKNYQASNSTFNTANILKEGTKERQYFELAVADLAEQLTTLQDAGVPLIFRPLHEAQGNYGRFGDGTSWFWWGDRGPEVFKELWKLLYTMLTEDYGLHNLIWEMNLYELDSSYEWYPGDEYVDMVGYDKYEGSPYTWGDDAATSVFLTLVGDTDDTKMVALAECDKIPAIDNMVNEGAWWLYFCPWYYEGDSDAHNSAEKLNELYNSDYVITLGELPNDLYGYPRGNGGSWDVAGAYECEDGKITLSGGGTETIQYKYCSGGAYVFLKGEDDAIEQTVTVDQAGTYSLIYCYQQQYEEAGKTEAVYVNGEKVADVLFPMSITFTECEPITVDLKAGENTIKLSAVEGWIWFDYLLVSDGSDVTTTPTTPDDPVGVRGDADCNGVFELQDAVLLARAISGSASLSTQGAMNCDVDGESGIGSNDLTLILKALSGSAKL